MSTVTRCHERKGICSERDFVPDIDDINKDIAFFKEFVKNLQFPRVYSTEETLRHTFKETDIAYRAVISTKVAAEIKSIHYQAGYHQREEKIGQLFSSVTIPESGERKRPTNQEAHPNRAPFISLALNRFSYPIEVSSAEIYSSHVELQEAADHIHGLAVTIRTINAVVAIAIEGLSIISPSAAIIFHGMGVVAHHVTHKGNQFLEKWGVDTSPMQSTPMREKDFAENCGFSPERTREYFHDLDTIRDGLVAYVAAGVVGRAAGATSSTVIKAGSLISQEAALATFVASRLPKLTHHLEQLSLHAKKITHHAEEGSRHVMEIGHRVPVDETHDHERSSQQP